MLDRTNITFLSEKFLGNVRVYLMVQMTTIVIAVAAALMAILVVSIVEVSATFAVTDNNTDARAEAVENDSSGVVAADGSSDNNESAKSGDQHYCVRSRCSTCMPNICWDNSII